MARCRVFYRRGGKKSWFWWWECLDPDHRRPFFGYDEDYDVIQAAARWHLKTHHS